MEGGGGGEGGEVRERGFRSSNLPDLYVLSLHARGFTDYAPVDRARSNELGGGGGGSESKGPRERKRERRHDVTRGVTGATRTSVGIKSARTRTIVGASANRAVPTTRTGKSAGGASITRLLSAGKKK